MNTATIDDERIEERIENPEPKHLLRLREGRVIGAHTDSYDIVGRVTEEGELEVTSDGEVGVIVSVYILLGGGEPQFAYLIYSNDSLGEKMELNIVGPGGESEPLEGLEVVSDE